MAVEMTSPEGDVLEAPYRYRYWQNWPTDGQKFLVIACNPSVGKVGKVDNTLQKIIDFGKRKNFSGFRVANLYAHIDTDPKEMKKKLGTLGWAGLEGPNNNFHLDKMIEEADVVFMAYGKIAVTGWGGKANNKEARDYAQSIIKKVKNAGKNPYTFDISTGGIPKHPLYIPPNTMDGYIKRN